MSLKKFPINLEIFVSSLDDDSLQMCINEDIDITEISQNVNVSTGELFDIEEEEKYLREALAKFFKKSSEPNLVVIFNEKGERIPGVYIKKIAENLQLVEKEEEKQEVQTELSMNLDKEYKNRFEAENSISESFSKESLVSEFFNSTLSIGIRSKKDMSESINKFCSLKMIRNSFIINDITNKIKSKL